MFIFPIPAEEEFRFRNRRALVVWTLVVLNAGAFLGTLPHLRLYIDRYGFVPASASTQTALSSMFLHTGWLHLLGNMFFLLMFGRVVENAMGSAKFVLSYFAAGVAAVTVHAISTSTPTLPLVGASGAISGVMGMYLVLFPQAPVDLYAYVFYWQVGSWRSTGLVATGIWFAKQLALALLTSVFGMTGGTAFWAHVGGFVAGVMLGFVAGRLAVG